MARTATDSFRLDGMGSSVTPSKRVDNNGDQFDKYLQEQDE